MILKIENISINKLMPYENNARKHTEDDVQTIINSIQEFGFNDPVGVWGENNIIVEGHGRFLAAKKLGIKEIPCIRLDELSDEQRKAYSLAHNKTAEMSTWDFDKLETELESISFDMSDFGFDINNNETDLFGYIENDDFVSKINDKQTFSLTLEIQTSARQIVESYVKQNGKKRLVEIIMEEIKNA